MAKLVKGEGVKGGRLGLVRNIVQLPLTGVLVGYSVGNAVYLKTEV
jgi:hypothetical protein